MESKKSASICYIKGEKSQIESMLKNMAKAN